MEGKGVVHMEIKQAIHCLKNDCDEETCRECDFYHDCTYKTRVDVARLAISALEKQIPKKPITYKDTNRADCPVCGATVRGIKEPFGDWCSKCGQALDWSE